MNYFDSSYLVRLYYDDPGFEAVRELAATAPVACSILGRAETAAALHRKLRDGHLSPEQHRVLLTEFAKNCAAGAFRWLPLSRAVIDLVGRVYETLPANVFLRAADAIHLASAIENGLSEIHSHDSRQLAAAPYFDLTGSNVIV